MAQPAQIARRRTNKLKPDFNRTIYLDAGCWQSLESGYPRMTFGLLEHNAIALCSYFSNGEKTALPTVPKIGYKFRTTQIRKFLMGMLERKYQRTFRPQSGVYGYHIQKIIPFPTHSLLNNDKELCVFVPDLHLHLFKGTYLDNFITQYENQLNGEQVIAVPLPGRRSMEYDFAEFLYSVRDFQKANSQLTRVFFLGDMYELWESQEVLRNFTSPDRVEKVYAGLDQLTTWLHDDLSPSGPRAQQIKKFLKLLNSTKLSSIPLDPNLQVHLSKAYASPGWRKLLIDIDDSSENVVAKAKAMKDRIRQQYRGADRRSFSEILDEIYWKINIIGNHDNFLAGVCAANWTYTFGEVELNMNRFRPMYSFERCDLYVHHGHNMDDFNNDDACATGYLITALLTYYELKKRGDILKKFESTYRSHEQVRLDYLKRIARVCYFTESERPESKRKNRVFVHGHTHHPYLKDVSNEYLLYRAFSDSWPESKGRPMQKRLEL